MEQELKMEVVAFNAVKSLNIALNDLAFAKHLLNKLSQMEDRGSLDTGSFTNLSGAIINLSINKADCLKGVLDEDCPLRPTDEGVKLIEFWLEAKRLLCETEDEDEQED